MKKQSEITDRTRQAFIDAFCLLYAQKPFEKITVQEITRKAGFNRSTFYQYFLDINEVLSYVENDLLEYMAEKRRNAGKKGNSFVNDLVDLYEERAIYINALLGDFGSSHFFDKLKAKANSDVLEFIPSKDDALKAYLMEFRFSGALSLFRLWLHKGQDLSTEKFLTLIEQLYNQGISSVIGSESKIQVSPTQE
jgi:AcrR family transcriptional regulator